MADETGADNGLTPSDDASSAIGSADVGKNGKWGWYAEDNSMVTLYRGDPLMSAVLSIAPCEACQKRNTDRLWGRCSMPTKKEADELLHVLNSHDALMECAETLREALLFIRNGVELGYIHIPKNDPACEMLPKIARALHRLESSNAG